MSLKNRLIAVLAVLALVALAVNWLGYRMFARMRPAFADVL